jgi:hypothetical protein
VNDPSGGTGDLPRTPLEARVLMIWKDILRNDGIGVTDNFFNVGGDSIKLIKLLAVIRSEFNVSFKLIEIYGNESVRKMSRLMSERTPGEPAGSDAVDEQMEALKSELLKSL